MGARTGGWARAGALTTRQGPRRKAAVAVATLAPAVLAVASPVAKRAAAVLAVAKLAGRAAANTGFPGSTMQHCSRPRNKPFV